MNALVAFFLHTEVGHDILYAVAAIAIGSLDSPTKDSGPFYRWLFKFGNGIIALNPRRALNSSVESSPNWKDAVDKHVSQLVEVGVCQPMPDSKGVTP
jgi:hypothetical protein